ncbi:hypothetical protein N7536_010638 [Penicillium majusculum]|nr:hypothetical protein N7536_010638 [Penicillium majusculum]
MNFHVLSQTVENGAVVAGVDCDLARVRIHVSCERASCLHSVAFRLNGHVVPIASRCCRWRCVQHDVYWDVFRATIHLKNSGVEFNQRRTNQVTKLGFFRPQIPRQSPEVIDIGRINGLHSNCRNSEKFIDLRAVATTAVKVLPSRRRHTQRRDFIPHGALYWAQNLSGIDVASRANGVLEFARYVSEHQSAKCGDGAACWVGDWDSLDERKAAVPNRDGVFHRSNGLEGTTTASIYVAVDLARWLLVEFPRDFPGYLRNCRICPVASSASNVHSVAARLSGEPNFSSRGHGHLCRKHHLEEATFPAVVRHIDIELDSCVIEVSRDLAMLERRGLVGLVGKDRRVIDGVNTVGVHLHRAICNQCGA